MHRQIWWHGTEARFDHWAIPPKKVAYKNGMDSHSAIFFSSDRQFAKRASNGTGLIAQAQLTPDANVLDMNAPPNHQSEVFRKNVLQKPLGKKNPNAMHAERWTQAWRHGAIMRYAPNPDDDMGELLRKRDLALNARHTAAGIAAFNELQSLTRQVIEELVVSARELGFDAVMGNEIDTTQPGGPAAYPTMFVLNPQSITPPVWS